MDEIDIEETKLDKLKVKDVAKTFPESLLNATSKTFPLPDFRKERDLRRKKHEERTVENTVGKYGITTLEHALSGEKPEYLVQYWTSYEDHIKRYEEKIEDYKAEILYNIEVLKNLIKAREDVIKQAEDFKKEEFEPYTWPMKGCDDKELDKKCHDAIKAHEIKFHMDYVLERTMPSLGVLERKSKYPHYEMICDCNGKLKYIRCTACYKDYILNEDGLFSREYNDMTIGDEPGAK